MNATSPRSGSSWSARLLIALTLVIVGAAAATWALARYDRAAQLLGVAAVPQPLQAQPRRPVTLQPQGLPDTAAVAPDASRLAQLEARLARVETATQRAQGSAGRADALVIAFAARRAIDRGVPLGYLENLLVDRFGAQYPQAVATVVTASRQPVRLDQLTAEYESLGPALRGGGRGESWLGGFRREIASMMEIRHSGEPSTRPDARYRRALARLGAGQVDAALAETMRLPGAGQAGPWVAKARRYVAAHRALDQVESAALLGRGRAPGA